MVKRIIIIVFLLTQPVKAECKYYAEADVVDGKLINKNEHYTCKKDNFFIQFMTEEKYHNAFMFVMIGILENI